MTRRRNKIKIPLGSRAVFLKLSSEYFVHVMNNTKRFEVRNNDRQFKLNDTLVLQEWDPINKGYTGRQITRQVLYILPLSTLIPNSPFVVLSLGLPIRQI